MYQAHLSVLSAEWKLFRYVVQRSRAQHLWPHAHDVVPTPSAWKACI